MNTKENHAQSRRGSRSLINILAERWVAQKLWAVSKALPHREPRCDIPRTPGRTNMEKAHQATERKVLPQASNRRIRKTQAVEACFEVVLCKLLDT